MSEYILSCCSTADLPYDYFKSREIPFVSFHYIMDGKDHLDDMGQTISFDEFYKRIEEGAMPTTSQVNVGEFMDFFEPFLKAGKDVLHISFSSGLSGTYNAANLAKAELLTIYTDRIIHIVDSLAASSGYGLLIDLAADLRDEGESINGLYQWLEENKLKVQHWFFSTDLTHYKRGGRITPTAAMVGTILNICPLLKVDGDGHLTPNEKIRGKKHAINGIVKKMEQYADGGKEYSGKCFISQSACYDDACQVASQIEERFPNLNGKVKINSIGTVIGAHTGPGTVALFFIGESR